MYWVSEIDITRILCCATMEDYSISISVEFLVIGRNLEGYLEIGNWIIIIQVLRHRYQLLLFWNLYLYPHLFVCSYFLPTKRAPFVFTKDFAYVIDSSAKKGSLEKSEKMKEFVDICCKAYNVLRQNAHMFINLFSLVSIAAILLSLHK